MPHAVRKQEQAEARRGTRIRIARWMVTEWAAEGSEVDKRLDKVSLACVCGRVWSPLPHKTLTILCLGRQPCGNKSLATNAQIPDGRRDREMETAWCHRQQSLLRVLQAWGTQCHMARCVRVLERALSWLAIVGCRVLYVQAGELVTW